ncbi:Mediator of RNA polymerase II transcription subunit [Ooceraea biroi]|uniref:Mediator of RNA polymerase II transcription subunit 25 n=1 Tax=Ooceraea biroi TaxID=2015173 RepID=A0A026W177_OOCBI|nr:Mediator of RNA polymerase II transcription subunit [Ooceraea biroi]
MVTGPAEHVCGIQADVIFVIEGTAVNGAYLNDLKTNYLVPTLEYFSQGGIEDREYVSENSTTLYGIVVYHAADCLPAPCTETLGPYSNPHKLLMVLDKLEMVGGKGESFANIGEGLATGLQCFEDLQLRREPNTASQKHCILICNSPPYQTMIQESYKFAGHTIEQIATIYQERNINISILSPRKIPALYKLFEKAGGDLQSSQTKNYAKDPRHLVLLRNYNLKERPVSPQIGGNVHTAAVTAAQIPLSPLQSNDSPNTNQVQQNMAPPESAAGSQAPQNIANVHQTVTPSMAAPMNAARPPYNPQIAAPPNYHPAGVNIAARPTRWMRPFIAPSATAPANAQGSALIAQLTQPPSSLGLNVAAFNQRLDAGNNVMAPNPQQQQQQLTQQQQQLRLTMQLQQQQQQQNAQQATMSMAAQPTHNQSGSQLTVSCISQSVPTQVPQTVTVSQQAPVSVSSITQQITHPQAQNNVATGTVQGQQLMPRERQNIWQGIVEWIEKAKNPTDAQKQTRHVPCQVSANSKDGDPELKADTWPPKLIMQLMPKQLIGNIGGSYLKNSKSVLFHPTPCEALESLTKMMSAGFAGCVHFTSAASSPACEIKVLILLYTAEKKTYLGFIPNDQTAFVDRLRKVIQQQKTSQASMRQGQVNANPGPGNAIPAPMPTTGAQGGILMSQTNTMTMGGGQITQNVVSTNAPPQTLTSSSGPQAQMNMQNSGISGPQANAAAGEAAQQQEAQYKSQLEVNAGCVHFTSAASSPACEIKVLILLYTAEKKTYLGFIPNDQTAFVDRLRKVIQQQKTSQASMRQGQVNANPGPGNAIPAPMPTTGAQGGILMSQTNTMTMGGGQITQNVVSTNAPPQTLTSSSGPQAQMNMQMLIDLMRLQNSGISGPQANAAAGGMIGQQRPPFDDIEMARHQNLLKIQHLRQTLEAAQQQEAQYKSQLEVNAQQAQRGLNQAAMANQQANAQRLMRPVTTNNLGLRHLLQQPQPQYRQVFGVQQQMVGPRGQIATRPMAPGNAQNQQFEDVPNYDFLN